jgi:hypothetical protein
MPKTIGSLYASLGKDERDVHTETVKVGVIKEHSDGSRYIAMDRLFNYALIPGGNVKYFYLQVKG